jgi:hypothetical protein
MTISLSRIGSVLPEPDENVDVEQLTDAFEDVDENLGAVVVAQLSDITSPYNGMLAYASDVNRLYLRVDSAWVLLAVKSTNNVNTKVTTLGGTELTTLAQDSGGFQVGDDGDINTQHTGNQIQARNDNNAAALNINPLGGDVKIGESGKFTLNDDGFIVTDMDAKENQNNTTISVTITDYGPGSQPADITCVAPPSGKILVIATSQFETPTTSDVGWFSFYVTLGGDEIQAAGGAGKQAEVNWRQGVAVVVDMVRGLTPGSTYRFRTAQKRDAGDTVSSKWRKLIVQPMF